MARVRVLPALTVAGVPDETAVRCNSGSNHLPQDRSPGDDPLQRSLHNSAAASSPRGRARQRSV